METIKHKFTTVGELKKFLADIDDDVEIQMENVGNTGYVEDSEVELIRYPATDLPPLKPDLYINIKAESCYHY